jgi:hypothetical protein
MNYDRVEQLDATTAVIPAQAGIQRLQELTDSRFRGSDDDWVFFDTLSRERGYPY